MNLDDFLVEAHAGIRIPRKPEVVVIDDSQETPDYRSQMMTEHKLTIQEILDCVSAVSAFGHSLTHESAMQLQADINRYNGKHGLKICIIMGVDEGGYRWHLWGPTAAVSDEAAADLCEVFDSYMTGEQLALFRIELSKLNPWFFFFYVNRDD